jgi:hypothetical protein
MGVFYTPLRHNLRNFSNIKSAADTVYLSAFFSYIFTRRIFSNKKQERACLRWLVTGFPLRRSGIDSRSRHVGFVVDKVEMESVFFSSTSVSPANSHLSCSSGTIGPVADIPSGLRLTPLHEKIKKRKQKAYCL